MSALPNKQEYLANLRASAPPEGQAHCPICWDSWDHPAKEVVEACTDCARHPLHKDCLAWTFATEDGEEVSNRCPVCRRELFEKITSEAADNNDDNTVGIELWPGGLDVLEAIMQGGFWACFPDFMNDWLTSTESSNLQQLIQRPAYDGITDTACAVIDILFEREQNNFELTAKTLDLVDHLFGDTLLQIIGGAIEAFEDTEFGNIFPGWNRASRLLIACYVVTDMLTMYSVDQHLSEKRMELQEWLALVRFRHLLYDHVRASAPSDFFNSPIGFSVSIPSLFGLPEDENLKIDIEYPVAEQEEAMNHQSIELSMYPGTLGSPWILQYSYDEGNTRFHIGPYSDIYIAETKPGSLCDCSIDVENGCIEFTRGEDHCLLLRIRRRKEDEQSVSA